MITSTLRALARDCLISAGAQICKYTGDQKTTDVWGVIEERSQIVGGDFGSVGTDVWTLFFLDDEIPDPQRGDKIEDEHGKVWIFHEQLESINAYVSNWSIVKR